MPRWRHNCVISHVTKVYFIELVLNITCTYIEFWRQNLDQKPVKMSENLTSQVVGRLYIYSKSHMFICHRLHQYHEQQSQSHAPRWTGRPQDILSRTCHSFDVRALVSSLSDRCYGYHWSHFAHGRSTGLFRQRRYEKKNFLKSKVVA